MTDRIEPPEQREIDINDEMAQSFVDYAMSVIVSRALPDVRDGLKPVQRRIVYSMSENNMGPNTPHQKCAQVVGDVMGRYHPHNQDAIYEALVRMGQTFSLRHLLIDPQGNFGTVDDPAGAMRYCVTGDTLIRTPSGTHRIDSLGTVDPNSEIDLDLKVLGRTGSVVRATKLFHSGVHPVLRLRTAEGHRLTGTSNHPVLTLTQIEGIPLLLWRLLSELRPGHTVVMSRMPIDEPEFCDEQDLLAGFLAGAWVAEGHASTSRAGFNNTDEVFFEAVVDAYDTVVGGPRYLSSRRLPSGKVLHEIDIHNLRWLRSSSLVDLIGTRSSQKRIPVWIWRAAPSVKRAFLAAMFEGDGSVSSLGRNAVQVTYSTRSGGLADDLQQLLLEFGVSSRRACYENGEIKVVVTGRWNLERFAARVGFWGSKQRKLAAALGSLPATTHARSHDRIPYVSEYIRVGAARGWREWLAKHELSTAEVWARRGDELLAGSAIRRFDRLSNPW